MASKKYTYLKRTDKGWLAKPSACYLGPNARTVIDPEKLERLQAQITGVGVKEPLLVRRTPGATDELHLQIWGGQRRFTAVNNLLAKGEPIEWIPVRIEQGSDADMMIAAAQTVTGKEPLDPVDEAGMVTMLLGYGLEADEIAKRLGMSVAWVNRRRKLQRLEPKARAVLREGRITIGRAEELADMAGPIQLAKLPADGPGSCLAKPQGKLNKRPGKKQIRTLTTRLKVSMGDNAEIWDRFNAVLRWVCGDLTSEELQQQLGLEAEPTEAEPCRYCPPALETSGLSGDPEIRAAQEAELELADQVMGKKPNPNVAKVQQALGVEPTPPARPSQPSGV